MVRPSDCLARAWAQVRRRPGQAAGVLVLSLLATALALASLGSLDAALKASQQRLGSLGAHLVVFVPGESRLLFGSTPAVLLEPALLDRLRALPDVAGAVPELAVRLPGGPTGEVQALGYPPGASPVLAATTLGPADLIAGRWPSPDEADAVLVTEGLARSGSLGPGSPLVLGGLSLKVVGVVQPGVKAVTAEAYLPWDTLQNLVGAGFNIVAVEARSASRLSAALEQVHTVVPGAQVGAFACAEGAVRVFGLGEDQWWVVNLALWSALGLSVLVGTGAALRERRHDFAILRTCGWSPGALTFQLVAEALGPSLVGSAGGLAAGALGAAPWWLFLAAGLGPPVLTLAASWAGSSLLGRPTVAQLLRG